MPAWKHELIDPNDEAMIDRIFQLGMDSQLPAELGCTPIPYPTKTRIRDVVNNPDWHSYVIYANGNDLRVAIAFDDEGCIRFCVSKPWANPQAVVNGAPPHPNGVEQSDYLHGLVRQMTGTVKTFNNTPHSAIAALHKRADVTIVEVDSTGHRTGREKKPQ